MDFVVQWNIKAVENYLFNIWTRSTVKAAAESAIARSSATPLEGTLTQLRGEVQNQTRICCNSWITTARASASLT